MRERGEREKMEREREERAREDRERERERETRLDAFDMRCHRKILSSLTKQPVLSNTIRKRRLQWFGNLQRMVNNRIHKKLYQWTPIHGKSRPGRPRKTWKNFIKKDLRKLGTEWSIL